MLGQPQNTSLQLLNHCTRGDIMAVDQSSCPIMPPSQDAFPNVLSSTTLLQTAVVTAFSVAVFISLKMVYDILKQSWSHITMVVVGAGPIGLLSVVIGMQTGRITKVIVFEKDSRSDLLNRPHQIGLDVQSVKFLQKLGVDFDNIEGCWKNGCFFTRVGVFIEYLLSMIQCTSPEGIQIRFNTKLGREQTKELDALEGRVVVIICDGAQGQTDVCLGLNDNFSHHSMHAFGAVATVECRDACPIPTPEIRVHNLTFDLDAYTNGLGDNYYLYSSGKIPKPLFHLKIFGSTRQRYLALAVQRTEAHLVRMLRVILDRSLMRNIFQVCFNTFKCEEDTPMSDTVALRQLKFSPQLFEIRLSHRLQSVVYFQETDTFVLSEGESARNLNFHTGMDMNVSVCGLQSLGKFLHMVGKAETMDHINEALNYKQKHSMSVSQEYIKTGMRNYIFT